MNRVFKSIVLGLVAVASLGCIRNDIPYPIIKLDILTVEAEGMKSTPKIDATNHTVKLELEETADIRNVHITNVATTEGAESDVLFPGYFDLRKPLYVNLSMYQTFEWTITAEQRYRVLLPR